MFLADKVGGGEHGHKLQKDKELGKEEERRYREKKEHSIRLEKDRLSKERGHKSYKKEEEERHKSKRSVEEYSCGDRGQPAEDRKRVKSGENERKKLDLRVSCFVFTLKIITLSLALIVLYIITDKVSNKNSRIVCQLLKFEAKIVY